ncbi:hypothetical protein MSPP1_003091 [Malassezia sp. CBS 17886]|nr:hypothetical protein MSPP1_003091 [Malassezia sp. CBS 17886]
MSAFRASRTLLNKLPESPHKYHYTEGKTPFWRKIRSLLSLNPEISSGLPQPQVNRNPPPGSRPETPAAVPSKASDIAENLYGARDFRRQYPKLEVVTQQYLTELLLAEPNEDGTKSLPIPGDGTTTAVTRPADIASPTAFTEVLAQVHSEKQHIYSPTNMPPRYPSTPPSDILKLQKDAVPHPEDAYYPATLQRLNVITSFALSVASVLVVLVALTNVRAPEPEFAMRINSADVVHGKARWHSDRRAQDFAEVDVDLDVDAFPLFNWNTKQVFLSLLATYGTPRRPENEVVVWDKIIASKADGKFSVQNLRNKYGVRDVSKSFQNTTSLAFQLRWNVMPYVGWLVHGASGDITAVQLDWDASTAEKMRLLPY